MNSSKISEGLIDTNDEIIGPISPFRTVSPGGNSTSTKGGNSPVGKKNRKRVAFNNAIIIDDK